MATLTERDDYDNTEFCSECGKMYGDWDGECNDRRHQEFDKEIEEEP